MPRSSAPALITGTDFYSEETNPSTNIGALAWTDDGRAFRYVLAGASALVAGDLQQTQAEDTNFNQMAVQAAAAVGVKEISITLGSTATTANLFDGGILTIDTAPGLGQVFTILSHEVKDAAATCKFTVLEPVMVALTTSSKATVRANPFKKVIIFPTTSTGMPVGGAIKAITAAKYGWIQSHGMGGALSDATVTANDAQGLAPSAGTAGAVTQVVAAGTEVGRSLALATISAAVTPIFWTLD